jgi:branched-chain amino acid transport system permease protein
MKNIVLFAVLGLGSGALIAGVALSLILSYRGSGVINLAAGSVTMVTGYAFWEIRTAAGIATGFALVLALVVAALVGLLMEFCAFRPLRTATPLAKLVASLGILLVAQAGLLLAFGPNAQSVPAVLPTNYISVLGVQVTADHFILTGIVIVIAVVLAAAYRWTRFGLSTRAAAESEVSAMLVGLSPDRLSVINTVLAALVAGTLGVLAAPLITLDTSTLPLIVIPSLAAALFARFTSFGVACVVGLVIGAGENILFYLSTQSWFPTDKGLPWPGVEEILVFAAILVALFWRGAALPTRGEVIETRLPAVPRGSTNLKRPALVAAIAGAAALVLLPYDFRQAFMTSTIGTALALSLVVIVGFAGQISVMQLALSGIAGYTVSHLATGAGIAFPLAPIIGALAATAVGLVTGASALRVRGVTLAVVTLAAADALEQGAFNSTTVGGGVNGAPVPQPRLLGLNLGNNGSFLGIDGHVPSPVLGWVVLATTIGLCLFVANLRRGSVGTRMLAVRSNERAAAAAGINVRGVKLFAFGVSSCIAGIAGAMAAYNFGSVSADQFDVFTALAVIAFVYVGGITMVSGAVFAGFLATQGLSQYAFQKWFGISGTWVLLLAGITLLGNLVFYPDGVAGATYYRRQRARLKREAAGVGSTGALGVFRRGAVPPPAAVTAPESTRGE